MLKFGKIEKRSPRVNMIPIINVVFLLLIYFISQGNMQPMKQVEVSPPNSSSSNEISAEPIELYVNNEQIVLNKQVLDAANLQTELAKIAKKYPSKQILLKVDAKLDSTKLIDLLKVVKAAKVSQLYLVTNKI